MKINYIGPEPYIDNFEQDGTVFSRGEDYIECADYQADVPVVVDIAMAKDGRLVFGASDPGAVYVANLIIPAREYEYSTETNPDTGEDVEIKTPLPLDMSRVEANLWTFNNYGQNSQFEEAQQ